MENKTLIINLIAKDFLIFKFYLHSVLGYLIMIRNITLSASEARYSQTLDSYLQFIGIIERVTIELQSGLRVYY